MFNVTGGEFLIIFLVALVVLGPTKLPEAARQVGKIVGEFRRISSGFQREIQSAMNDPVSKVTGEATPKTLKDVASVAEVPPMAEPATPSSADEDNASAVSTEPTWDSTPPRKGPVFNTAAVPQTASLDDPEPFVPAGSDESTTDSTDISSNDPIGDVGEVDVANDIDDPPMYGDR